MRQFFLITVPFFFITASLAAIQSNSEAKEWSESKSHCFISVQHDSQTLPESEDEKPYSFKLSRTQNNSSNYLIDHSHHEASELINQNDQDLSPPTITSRDSDFLIKTNSYFKIFRSQITPKAP